MMLSSKQGRDDRVMSDAIRVSFRIYMSLGEIVAVHSDRMADIASALSISGEMG